MTDFTFDHHPSLRLPTNAEDVSLPRLATSPHATAMVFQKAIGASLARCGLDGRPTPIFKVETRRILFLNVLHVRFENVQGSVGFSKQLFALPHPVLVPFLFPLEVYRPGWPTVELLK